MLGIAQGTTDQWRGIPYAAPPVGDLRWRPPAPMAPWTDVRDATEFTPPCIQQAFDAEGPAGTTGREDCLYLNVFAPASVSPASRLAVMVHLHGGGNFVGAPYQDATALVEHNVIVVTLAYRLGVFGFLGHPALSEEGGGASGEYGLFDQLAALQWVHDNIAAFGGDPSNVTLFGQSAGSYDTVALMASPLSQGLLSRAAVQGDLFWPITGKGDRMRGVERRGFRTLARFRCGDGRKALSCWRALCPRARQGRPGHWIPGQHLPACWGSCPSTIAPYPARW